MDEDRLIIANCSGFFGDRFSAAEEMVNGGRIDVLTGDYLAELTMAILFQQKLKNPQAGYVDIFLKQMKNVMGQCLNRSIKVVTNAGGLNPRGLASALHALAAELGISPKIAWIEGDDLLPRLKDLQAAGARLTHLDHGIDLADGDGTPVSANAYLGGWGITAALKGGADIVVCGRVADAALISGPCAWRFDWAENDWDCLAGAYAAGHVIECGTQACGGNYAFMDEVPNYSNIGFPLAEMFPDGSSVITKHEGTGGLVSIGTVTAQLVYEIRTPTYLTPDVRVRFDTLTLTPDGKNRVRLSGVRGLPAPESTKVCLNLMSGYRNSMTIVLTGLDIEKKARIVEENLWNHLGGEKRFGRVKVQLIRSDKENPPTNEEALAYLKVTVMDADPDVVGRSFSSGVIEMVLSSIPGFTVTHPPTREMPVVIHWPAVIDNRHISQTVFLQGDQTITIVPAKQPPAGESIPEPAVDLPDAPGGPMQRVPLGRLFAARSGDKGGNANLGVWAKTPESFAFLRQFLTIDRLRELLPDIIEYEVERYELGNLLAINFYIIGLLGDGAAASCRLDPQAKTLAEYLRAKEIDAPVRLLP